MNNNIIKSLRRTLLCSVAAAVVTIGFTACADDALVTQNANAPSNANGYKFSIPANMGGGTRAIAYNSETGNYDATFETSDRIFVYNVTKDAEGYKIYKYDGGEKYETAFLNPDANGKTANLCGQIDAFRSRKSGENVTPEKGDELMLFYNTDGTYLNYNRNYTGDWYYNSDIADYAIASVKITSIDGGVIKTEPSSFLNPQSIYKIKFTGDVSDVKIKKVNISSEQYKLVNGYNPTNIDYPNNFGSVSYIYADKGTDQHELTFMLRFADDPYSDGESTSGDVIYFVALDSDGYYYKGTKSVTTKLENGKYYQAEVAMEKAGLAMVLTNNTSGESVVLSNEWTYISTKEYGYTATNTAINTSLSWYGGDQALTLKGVSVNSNNYNAFIDALSDYDDPENTKVHKLVLDGVNTLNTGLWIGSYGGESSLSISALSGGKLDILSGGISFGYNATLTIESGEVSVDILHRGENCSVILSGDAKLRVGGGSYDFIKAANGYVLNTTKEGDYTVYTVSPAPDPIALSAVTTDDIGKIIGSDGNVYVPNYGFSDNIRPVGMIASISSSGHGLAIAMEAIRKNSDDYRNGFSWDNSGEANDGKTATEIFQNWATNNEVSFGTWRIPTKSDCQDMILGCRIDGDATVASDENMTSNGFGTKLVAAGICTDDYFYFGTWTSTSGQDGEIYLGTNKSENGSFVAGFYNYSFSSTTTIFPVLEF